MSRISRQFKTVKALVVFPIEIELEIDASAQEEDIIDALGEEADRAINGSTIKPRVQESTTNPELIGKLCKIGP